MLAEHCLKKAQLILPIFIQEGLQKSNPVLSMPDVSVVSVDLCIEIAKEAYDHGIKAIMLFPRIDQNLKDHVASGAILKDNLICKAVAQLKRFVPNIGIIADIALDPYTSHGHDGVLDSEGFVDNDRTVDLLVQQAALIADAGCDILAPSDMMDGRVINIRHMLEMRGFMHTQIFSYAAKYASAFYEPFRDAVDSKISLGSNDKKHYQLDCANAREALRKITIDIKEGADAIIIKPAMMYSDIIKMVHDKILHPIFAYQVSGEYAMIKVAAMNGLFDYKSAQIEILTSLIRAGAQGVMTYAALEIAKSLHS